MTTKTPLFLALVSAIIICALFFFGRTVPEKKKSPLAEQTEAVSSFSIQQYLDSAKQLLPASQSLALNAMEDNIVRGDLVTQKIQSYKKLAAFWKDSVQSGEAYMYYTGEWAKLDNSEKNLTFAARLFSDNLRVEHDQAKLNWEAANAIDLYQQALKLNPDDADLKIGLGSSYIFGLGQTGKPEDMMQGVQQLLSVVREDSTNMKAQFVLGVGGLLSRQYDRAIERFSKVVTAQPGNIEAVAFLADAYAAKGDKPNAVRWYEVSKRLVNNPEYSSEVDKRIQSLR